MTRRWLGVALMLTGAVMAVVGLAGWALSTTDTASSDTTTTSVTTTTVATTTSSSTTTTTPPTTTSTTEPPSTTTTLDPDPGIESFIDVFTDAIERQDVDMLLGKLHPAVISLFGEEPCRTFISDEILQLEQYRLIGEAEGPTPQVVADMTIDMYRAPVAFAFQGQEFTSDAAFAFVDGEVRWFTQCGE